MCTTHIKSQKAQKHTQTKVDRKKKKEEEEALAEFARTDYPARTDTDTDRQSISPHTQLPESI